VDLDETSTVADADAPPGPHVLMKVTDTGCGMDEETLAHVFEPFFTTKERGKGTGLGLATVYGIAEQAGGRVTVSSEPGVGTTFRVYLPRVDAEALEPEPCLAVEEPRGGSETVLLVEDEDAVRATAKEALESHGYRVIEGRDGVDALDVACAHQGEIHLLVSDVVMPRLGGGELARRLVLMRPGLRVLFVSGYPDDALVRHGVAERGAALVQKPFTLSDFVRRVREVLDAPQRRAA
jgi:two-component system cell cycle sensor histidine kinase/response regulator CckA